MNKKLLVSFIASVLCIYCQGQTFEWAKHIGGKGESQANAIATDSQGNVYSAGTSADTTYFGLPSQALSYPQPANGPGYSYITKNDSAGNFIWVKIITSCSPLSMAIGNSGDVYITGYFSSQVDFDPGANTFIMTPGTTFERNIYILKLDNGGNFLWAKKIHSTQDNLAYTITTDLAENILLTGYFTGTADFDTGPATFNLVSAGSQDIFLLKLNTAGDLVWVKQIGGTDVDRANSVKTDSAGNAFITGMFRASVDFDPGSGITSFTAGAGDDAFVAKYTSMGTFLWANHIKGTSMSGFMEEYGNDITIDETGNCYVTGLFNNNTNFDLGNSNYTANNNGFEDIFISKYSTNGSYLWTKTIGSIYSDYPNSIQYQSSAIYIAGAFSETVDFDPGQNSFLLSASSMDAFTVKLDTSGVFKWAVNMGSNYDDYNAKAVIDIFDNVYITGYFQLTGDFDPSPSIYNLTPSDASYDIFLMRLKQDACSGIVILIDSLTNINCGNEGYAITHAEGGTSPYTYNWNTNPNLSGSSITFTTSGVYELTVTDANSCTKSLSLLVNEPDSSSGFDLNSNLLITEFRTGFPAKVWLDSYNGNCTSVGGTLKLILDTSLVIFDYAIPYPDLIYDDTLIWNFPTMNFDSAHFVPEVNLITKVSAAIGDSVTLSSIISPIITDLDSSNNRKNYLFPIINGYDPNDKQVYPTGVCEEAYISKSELLTYTVRFQNTGNASAINIFVLDSISPNIDLSTLSVVGSSHSMTTEVLPGNVLKFRFDNIQLIDSATNEPESHGYIIYQAKPNVSAANGNVIKNTGYIYFDFNPAVITNTVKNTLVDIPPTYCNMPVSVYKAINPAIGEIVFYPNPSADKITVVTTQPVEIFFYDVLGKQVMRKTIVNKETIDIARLNSGVYFIKSFGQTVKKLIKQ